MNAGSEKLPAVALETLSEKRRGPWIAIAAAIGVVVLLGVILTVQLGKGTVTVEGPDGGELPADVTIVLSDGGKQLQITSADKWKIAVVPGTYEIHIEGGNDQFEIKQDQVKVQRFGKQVVKVTRHDGAAAPAQAEKPSEPVNVAGRWQITDAANFTGEAYGGSIEMRVSSTGVVDLDWLDEQGNIAQTGIGLVEDGHLFAAWCATPAYGFCLYKLGPDGTMQARWTMAGAAGRLATETASGGTPGKLEGQYDIEGVPLTPGGRYKGTLAVAKRGDTYSVVWNTADGKYQGVGLRHGDYLAVAWSVERAEGYGIVDYKLEKDAAKGRWTQIGSTDLSFEILKRQPARP
jgi:hypothetical protein